jgi:hypothetical protein
MAALWPPARWGEGLVTSVGKAFDCGRRAMCCGAMGHQFRRTLPEDGAGRLAHFSVSSPTDAGEGSTLTPQSQWGLGNDPLAWEADIRTWLMHIFTR